MQNKLDSFFSKYEFALPLILFLLFLCVSLPGITWGAPSLWHPDEMVWRVDSALRGELRFDETEPDWNYPSLPKYVMYAIGFIIYGLGKSNFAFIVSARVFSSLLGAVSGGLIYYLARLVGLDKKFSTLAGILYIVSGVAAANGRLAHNDLYLQFFTILCIYSIIKYQLTKSSHWLYASFLFVGFATSSKYTGGSLMFVPIVVYLAVNWNEIRTGWLYMVGTLLLSSLIAFIGYVIGTPKSLLDPINYFLNIMTVLSNLRSYGFNSGSSIGLIGQWDVLESAVGIFCFYLFIFALIWSSIKLILRKTGKVFIEIPNVQHTSILILTLLIFDIPYLTSINYVERHFIPFIPFLAILATLFLKDVLELSKELNWKFIQLIVIILFSFGMLYSILRLISVSLLFINDARVPASEFIADMRGYGISIEYTLYPPTIEKRKFERAHNYPIYFVEWIGDTVPNGRRFEYNQGEKGLLDRDTDFFVIDSFTYERFYTDSICETISVECDFFKRLIAGEVPNFRLLKSFTYELPPFLPDVTLSAVNPDILIFERVR